MELENNGATAVTQPENDFITTSPEDILKEEAPAEEPKEVEKNTNDSEEVKPKRNRGYKAKVERLEAELAAYRQKYAPKTEVVGSPEPSSKPKLEDFDDIESYTEALTDWKVENKLTEREKKSKEESQKAKFNELHENKVKAYNDRAEELREAHEDFDDVIDGYDGPFTANMRAALLDSEMGPDVAYYIATTDGEGERLAGLGIIALNKAIAKIEAKLENRESKAVVKTTKAPPPITPIGKGKTAASKNPDEMSFEEYKAFRGYK